MQWDGDIGAVRGAVPRGRAAGPCRGALHEPTGKFRLAKAPSCHRALSLHGISTSPAELCSCGIFMVKQRYSLSCSPLPGLQQNKRESAASPASPDPVFSLPVVCRLCPITDFLRSASCNRLKPCGRALRELRRRFCGLFSCAAVGMSRDPGKARPGGTSQRCREH